MGHDSLFIKYANAYTTILVVKDRVLGHNPVEALYTADGYYQRLKKKVLTRSLNHRILETGLMDIHILLVQDQNPELDTI